jgi:sulfur carrier protein ThiS adenylyltransferase
MKKKDFFEAHDPKIVPVLQHAVIGIAGAGGLGSNLAVTLTRAGIGKLVIADFDKIEPSNLNRQQFFHFQIGSSKVQALAENLAKISPFTIIETHEVRLNQNNIPQIFRSVDILVEAFDEAEMKKMLIETWLQNFPQKPIIAASGLAGYGRNELLQTRKIDNLYICGDEVSEIEKGFSPMAPRVAIVANMQANLVLEIILKGV